MEPLLLLLDIVLNKIKSHNFKHKYLEC